MSLLARLFRPRTAAGHYVTRGAAGVVIMTAATAAAPGVGTVIAAAALTPLGLAGHRQAATRRGRRPQTVGQGTAAGAVTIGRLTRVR